MCTYNRSFYESKISMILPLAMGLSISRDRLELCLVSNLLYETVLFFYSFLKPILKE